MSFTEGAAVLPYDSNNRRFLGMTDSLTQNTGNIWVLRADNSTAKNLRTALYDATGTKPLIQLEDAAHASGDAGLMPLAVRKDTPLQLAGTDADYSPLINDELGRLWVRSNYTLPGTYLTSAARTATTTTATQSNPGYISILLFLNITVASGSGGLQMLFYGVDPVSGNTLAMNPLITAITATGMYGFEFGNTGAVLGGSGNPFVVQRQEMVFPSSFQVRVVHGDASSYTYSLGYMLIGG